MFYIGALGLLVARLIYLAATNLPLDCEEAQYWYWSKTLQLGYFSKPPLTSWLIALSTWLGHDSEFWVRFFAPICHTLTGIFLYVWVKHFASEHKARAAGLIYLTLPGTFFSSLVMTTDVPMLLFSTAAVFFIWKILFGVARIHEVILAGTCFGLATLSKYIALFIFVSVMIFLILNRFKRLHLTQLLGVLGIAFLVISPNLYWQYISGFPTFHHTAQSNIMFQDYGSHFHVLKALDYSVGQIGLFGPLVFFAFFTPRLWRIKTDTEIALHCFIWPIFGAMVIQALMAKVNLNWGVLMMVGVVPLVCLKFELPFLRKIVITNCLIGLLGWLVAFDYQATSRFLSLQYKGHKPHAVLQSLEDLIPENTSENQPLHLITGTRCLTALGNFYGKRFVSVQKWFQGGIARDHFDKISPYQERAVKSGSFLIAAERPLADFKPFFETIEVVDSKKRPFVFLARNFMGNS